MSTNVESLTPAVLDTDHRPWDCWPGEGGAAFHAFVHFRSLLSYERSLDRAYTDHLVRCKGKSLNSPRLLSRSPNWQRWRFRYSWPERAAAHDAAVAEVERQQQLVEIAAIQRRHTALALALQNVAV